MKVSDPSSVHEIANCTTPVHNNNEERNELQITTCLLSLKGHVSPVLSADWLTDGSSIASVSSDNSIWFWDAETGSCTHSHLNGKKKYLKKENFIDLIIIDT